MTSNPPRHAPPRLLITGAGGFLGSAVAHAGLDAGCEVVATARQPRPARLEDVRHRLSTVQLDLADKAALEAAVLEARPDVVIHCAWGGLQGADRFGLHQLDEVMKTCALVQAAADGGASKFIGIGSQAEYGALDRRATEDMPPRPNSLYGAAKVAASVMAAQLAAQSGLGFAWMRLFAVYGPGDNPGWMIPTIAAGILRGSRPRTTTGEQKWDYLYIDDAARAVVETALTADAVGVFNLASGHGVQVRRIIEKIRDAADPAMELVFGEVSTGPDPIGSIEGDIERLTAATGWRPAIGLDDGILRTVAALRTSS